MEVLGWILVVGVIIYYLLWIGGSVPPNGPPFVYP